MSLYRRRTRSFRRRRGGKPVAAPVLVPFHVHDDAGLTIGIEPYMWYGSKAEFETRLLQEYSEEPNPQMERIELEARVRIAVG